MKTKEQLKLEVIAYLTKASKHTFINPKSTFIWGTTDIESRYDYDYENFTYFKIIMDGDTLNVLENNKVRKVDIDWYINYYKNNSKCVIKNMLFLGKKMRAIKNNRYITEQVDNILLQVV